MGKHAYCIIAHSDPYCLQTLVDLIDDERNDIILVIDKKSDLKEFESIKASKSPIITPPNMQCVDIQWGSLSQVKAELLAFETAVNSGDYDYIHLISGQDLPLQNQDHIHSFFDSAGSGINFVGFAQGDFNRNDLRNKMSYYYLFTDKYRSANRLLRFIYSKCRNLAVLCQKMAGFKRKWNIKLYKGCNWVSITPEFAKYLVDNRSFILNNFRWLPCPDEIYKQTLIMNSLYRDKVYDTALDFAGMTRKIDWTRGEPYTWRDCDFDELLASDALFARKFSSSTDRNIIDRIANYLTNNGRK